MGQWLAQIGGPGLGPWASSGLQAHEEAWGDHDGPGRMRSGPWASSP